MVIKYLFETLRTVSQAITYLYYAIYACILKQEFSKTYLYYNFRFLCINYENVYKSYLY